MTKNANSYSLLALIFVLCFGASKAQAQYDPSKVSSKAKAQYQEAISAVGLMQFEDAEKALLKAIVLEPRYCDAWLLLGDVQREEKKPSKAIESYSKAILNDEEYCGKRYRTIAELYAAEDKYQEALLTIDKYLALIKLSSAEKIQGDHLKASYEFRLAALANPVPFAPHNLGDSINSGTRDYSPFITPDGGTLLFNRLLNNGAAGNEDFYISYFRDGHWTRAKNLGNIINTDNNEGAQCMSVDGSYMFFTRCNDKRNLSSGCDLYLTYKEKGQWTIPTPLGPPINTGDWESQPSFSADGRTLYFAAHRSKIGSGGADIYVSQLQADGKWSVPENLGPSVNSMSDENSPFIHPDGVTLYFASNGHPGMGKMDLFVTRKQADGSWSKPQNLGYPINTKDDETNLIVTADGKTAYYASSMGKGGNNLDIYTFQLNPEVQAKPVSYLKGKVLDKKTNRALGATLELVNLNTGRVVREAESNSLDGEFMFCLPAGEGEYAIEAVMPGYLIYSSHMDVQSTEENIAHNSDLLMEPIAIGANINLNNIYFATASAELQKKSFSELFLLVQLLKENPNMKIEIGGHTDNTGNSEDNLNLSQQRAESVVAFLKSKGITEERMKAKGYGETDPIASNETEEGRSKNRRTSVRILQ